MLSGGRFVLGLGTQVRAHNERRFGVAWSRPVARMREFVEALRAIWACWYSGTPLDFRGEFSTHTLMTPVFVPPDGGHGPPPVFLAAVGERMTQAAGEVADGLVAHTFTSPAYLTEVTIPAVERGLQASGRSRSDFEVFAAPFLVTGSSEEELATAAAGVRGSIAFYASTPAYRPVLVHHGWEDLQREANDLVRAGRWDDLGSVVDDEILSTFAVVADLEALPQALAERFVGVLDRVGLNLPADLPDDTVAGVVEAVRRHIGPDHTPS